MSEKKPSAYTNHGNSNQPSQPVLFLVSTITDPPARPEVRRRIEQDLSTDSELEAFTIDYFYQTYRIWTRGMDRTTKINELLNRNSTIDIDQCLNQYIVDRNSRPSLIKRAKKSGRRKIKKIHLFLSMIFGAIIEFLWGPVSILVKGLGITALATGTAATGGYVIINYTNVVPEHMVANLNEALGLQLSTPAMRARSKPTQDRSVIDLGSAQLADSGTDAGIDGGTSDAAEPDLAEFSDLGLVRDSATSSDLSLRNVPKGAIWGRLCEYFILDSGNHDTIEGIYRSPVIDRIIKYLGIVDEISNLDDVPRITYFIARIEDDEQIMSSNSKLIKWVDKNIVSTTNKARRECFQSVYNKSFQLLTRIYLAAHFHLQEQLSAITPSDGGVDAKDLCSNIDRDRWRLQKVPPTSLELACSFWERRDSDGTDKALIHLAEKIIRNYDPDFWRLYTQQRRHEKTADPS